MRLLLRVLGGVLLGAAALVACGLAGARFADGPIAILAGGPFKTGELQSGPEPDWSFVRDLPTIEFQSLEPARSRTTWILYHDGRIFIPCGYMNSSWGRIWKKWPIEAERDGRAIARIDGKLYERSLVRIQAGEVLAPVLAELSRKYVKQAIPLEQVTSGSLWIFEMAPRQ
jgi:hypothetical protein